MRSEGNSPSKNGEPTLGSFFTTMLQHTGRFLVKDFLAKNIMKTLEHPPYSLDLTPTWFLPVPVTALL
jgi:hypothetical protein